LAVAAAPVTLETASTRATALAGKVGFWEPNVPPAWAMIRFVPSWASWDWSWPLALSVRPMAQTMAATPMMGPSMIMSVLDLRAVKPFSATPMRSRAWLTQDSRPGARRPRFRRPAWRSVVAAVLATVMSWVTMTTARSGVCRFWKISRTWAALAESKAPVGSSASTISGSVTMARAKRHPLLLASRHLHRSVVHPGTQAELLERVVRLLPPLAGPYVAVQEGGLDVAERTEVGDEMELLEDEPDGVAAHVRAGGVVEPTDVAAGHAHLAGAGEVEQAEQAQHGRLPRARRPDDGDELTGHDAQRHVAQREDDHLLAVQA
jgi:hypothetical protein